MEQDKKDNKISLEDLIERERAALGAGTKITLESFKIWKEKKRAEKKKALQAETKKKKGKAKSGNNTGLTGKNYGNLLFFSGKIVLLHVRSKQFL